MCDCMASPSPSIFIVRWRVASVSGSRNDLSSPLGERGQQVAYRWLRWRRAVAPSGASSVRASARA